MDAAYLKNYLFSLLSRREYSEWELRQKLSRLTADSELINGLMHEFKEQNWQSDRRFTENLITGGQKKYGSLKLRHQLTARGINAAAAAELLPSAAEDEDLAVTLLKKKYNGFDPAPAAVQKYYRFLHSRGFTHEISRKALARWHQDGS